jgi:hypothetical protein
MSDPRQPALTLTREPGPDSPLVLVAIVECPDDDRKAMADALRHVADEVEFGISNACGGTGARDLTFDFSINFGTLDAVSDAMCQNPEVAAMKVAAHRVGETRL